MREDDEPCAGGWQHIFVKNASTIPPCDVSKVLYNLNNMAGTTQKGKTPRGASLGVNFEHGPDGAVVAYIGDLEHVIAYIPKNYSVNVRAATALAVYYRENSKGTPLSSDKTRTLLDRLDGFRQKPVIVSKQELRYALDEILKKPTESCREK